jgi:hypothetical protein
LLFGLRTGDPNLLRRSTDGQCAVPEFMVDDEKESVDVVKIYDEISTKCQA